MKVLLAIVAMMLGALGEAAAAGARRDVKRFALVVGANHGAGLETPLRYAETDAERIGETLAAVGDFPPDQVILLKGVAAADMRDALIRLNARLRDEEGDTLLFVYYSGHADATDLHLAGTDLPLHELRALVLGSAAASRILVLDACRSGALTRVKGGHPVPDFDVRIDVAPLPRGTAFITSSTATEDSQESDWLRGSIFTHYFNSALLGAADKDQDGRVTLGEAFAFAAAETYVASARTSAGPQNPTYRYDLGGRQDLVLTTPRSDRPHLGTLQFAAPGRYIVQRQGPAGVGFPIAEIAAVRPGARLSLAPGRYIVTLRAPDHLMEAPIALHPGGTLTMGPGDMHRLDYARVVRKGLRQDPIFSLVVGAGGRTNALNAEGAWQTTFGLRQDRRRFSWELRLGAAGGGHPDYTGIDHQHSSLSASILALRAVDFRFLTLSAGLEAGASRIRQTFVVRQHEYLRGPTGERTAWAPLVAPVLQVELPLRARGYLRLEGAIPWELMRKGNRLHSTETIAVIGLRGLVGLGIYF